MKSFHSTKDQLNTFKILLSGFLVGSIGALFSPLGLGSKLIDDLSEPFLFLLRTLYSYSFMDFIENTPDIPAFLVGVVINGLIYAGIFYLLSLVIKLIIHVASHPRR